MSIALGLHRSFMVAVSLCSATGTIRRNFDCLKRALFQPAASSFGIWLIGACEQLFHQQPRIAAVAATFQNMIGRSSLQNLSACMSEVLAAIRLAKHRTRLLLNPVRLLIASSLLQRTTPGTQLPIDRRVP